MTLPSPPSIPLTRTLDGYKSLLVEEEGGDAEEIVDEENGMLISTMLRQYFMALRTVGKWKYLNTHWDAVATTFSPLLPPSARDKPHDAPDVPAASGAWPEWLAKRTGVGVKPEDDSDAEDDDEATEDNIDLEVLLMRKYFWRWAGRAGVMRKACDPLAGDAVDVDWTRVIAPVLEGRITMVE